MARSIKKTFGNTSTMVLYKVLGSNGLEEKVIELKGAKSEKTARIELEKQLKTKNFMITRVDKVEGEEATYEMSADTFIAHSTICEDGASYGHDTITATFKLDCVWYFDLSGEMKHEYIEHTTPRKRRAAIAEILETENFIIDEDKTSTIDERRYMSKETFIANARKL